LTDAVHQTDRQRLAGARRWVVKVGSALLTNDGRGLEAAVVKMLADQLATLRSGGCDVVLVSSGAIVAGPRASESRRASP
jgi:glutamate 5-kinase